MSIKIYKNQTLQSASQLGFGSNFAFASDPVMSPNGVDSTALYGMKDGRKTLLQTEVTQYDRKTGLATIKIII